jgi:phage portal protein BeeE
MPRTEEASDGSFMGLVQGAYLRNSVVFSCLAIRARLFSEVRFQFQQLRRGTPGNLFGTPELGLLERPEPGKTTRDLLQTAILDADLGGNGFNLGRTDAIRRLRPDWMTIAYGSKRRDSELGSWDPDAEIIGYGYYPGGYGSGERVITFLPEEIAHFAPTKDPLARNRGISLLTAGLREVLGDNAATTGKLAFFNNAMTPNLALKFPPAMSKEKALEWIELMEQEHRGATKFFKTIFLGAGVEPVPVGLNFKDMDFTSVMAKAETRIAALTGMHPIIVPLSEGLQGSSLATDKVGSAARLVGDATLRPLWGDMAASLETIVRILPGTRLWYDDRYVPFLRNDVKDQAEITQKNAMTIGQLVKDGFTAESAKDYVNTSDVNVLEHTGLVSVQLQPPGAKVPAGQAETMRLAVSRLRELLAEGWRPATQIDEEVALNALRAISGIGFERPDQPSTYRATRAFWAVSEPLARLGTIAEGQVVPAGHALVAEFPSLFEPDGEVPDGLLGQARLLRSQGLSVPAIAARIDRTERHVYRLLSGDRA